MNTDSPFVELPVAVPPGPMTPRPTRVLEVRRELEDTISFSLDVGDRPGGFSFLPGQFNMLYAFGRGEAAISISGDPGRRDRLTHTVRAAGIVTRPMLDLKPGDVLGVRGPYGTGWPIPSLKGMDVLVAAGGIGLAPLRPLIQHVLAHREDYGRFWIMYGARTPTDILYPDELQRWRARFDVSLRITVDRGGPRWRGHAGVVTTLCPGVTLDADKTVALICGPETMMFFTVAELKKRGVPEDRIYVSMERNMQCAVGFCGHCQLGPEFICKDGPVFRFDRIARVMGVREL